MAVAALLAMCPLAALAGGQGTTDNPLRFVVYGDTRDGHEVHRKLVALMIQQSPEMVWQTGDLVHKASDPSLWKIYDDIVKDLRKKTQLYTVRGNHDFGGDGYGERMTSPIESGNKDYYSVTKGNSHLIALDVDDHSIYGPGTDQYKWLEADLKKAQSTSKHIFVFFHVAPYSIGSHGMNPEVQEKLCPLFIKYGVRIVFNGHDHNYYHTVRNGVTYVVSGGGGAPLYDAYPDKGAIPGDRYEKVHHYCLVDVKGDDVNVQVIRVDGSLLEKFTVSAKR